MSLLFLLIYIIYGLAVTLGGSVVYAVLTKVKLTSESQNLLLKFLALMDSLVGVSYILSSLVHMARLFDEGIICRISLFILSLSTNMTTNTLLYIAIDRLLSILKPLRYHRYVTLFRIKVLLFVSLLFSICLVSSVASADSFLDQFVYMNESEICTSTFRNPDKGFILLSFGVLSIYLPIVLILMSYLWIGTISRKQSKQISDVSNAPNRQDIKKKEWKGIKIALCLTGTFFLLWLPTLLISIIQEVWGYDVYLNLKVVAGILATSNSSCNLLLHFLLYKEFRKQAKQIFCFNMGKITCKLT